MTSNKAYLIRAFYEWILDNDLTPFITVTANIKEVSVPKQYIRDNQVILNISPEASNELRIGNDAIEFKTRFRGKVTHIYIPIIAVLAIFAQENNCGMGFAEEENDEVLVDKEETEQRETAEIIPFRKK